MSMKESYQQKLQAQLDEWNADIDKLKARAEKAESSARIEYYEQIEDLRLKQNAAKDKLAELHDAGDDAWEDLKAGIENAWSTLGDSVEQAVARFR